MIEILWFVLTLPWFLFKWCVNAGVWGLVGYYIYEYIQDAITYRRF